MNFVNRWNQKRDGIPQKVLDKVKPAVPLKVKIDQVQKGLQLQIVKLDSVSAKPFLEVFVHDSREKILLEK